MSKNLKFIFWSNTVEWGKIFCPMLGFDIMTYYAKGTPAYDSYTPIIVGADGETYFYKYDHDLGGWDEDAHVIDIEVQEHELHSL